MFTQLPPKGPPLAADLSVVFMFKGNFACGVPVGDKLTEVQWDQPPSHNTPSSVCVYTHTDIHRQGLTPVNVLNSLLWDEQNLWFAFTVYFCYSIPKARSFCSVTAVNKLTVMWGEHDSLGKTKSMPFKGNKQTKKQQHTRVAVLEEDPSEIGRFAVHGTRENTFFPP